MSDCTVYIDEAGDLGYQRGTRWFVLSAVIVEKGKRTADSKYNVTNQEAPKCQ